MIAKLSGRLDENSDNSCIIDVGGVGYLVFCSGRTLANLGQPGEDIIAAVGGLILLDEAITNWCLDGVTNAGRVEAEQVCSGGVAGALR